MQSAFVVKFQEQCKIVQGRLAEVFVYFPLQGDHEDLRMKELEQHKKTQVRQELSSWGTQRIEKGKG